MNDMQIPTVSQAVSQLIYPSRQHWGPDISILFSHRREAKLKELKWPVPGSMANEAQRQGSAPGSHAASRAAALAGYECPSL